VLAVFLLLSCNNEERNQALEDLEDTNEVVINIAQNPGEIASVDIKSNNFFWMIQPWKDGKLATIDGWGKFSEISFQGDNIIFYGSSSVCVGINFSEN
jgi:hypothetical protein